MKCYNCSQEISEVNICPYCKKNQIYENLKFNVNGVTFENEEGKDIQNEIRKICLEYERNGCFEKYGGYTNQEIKEFVNEVSEFEDLQMEMDLKEDTFEEKTCIKIYIKRYDNSYCHIGYMPKGLVKNYLKLKKNFKQIKKNINLVGGKVKQLVYDDETDKDKIEIIDLIYGFEVELIFYNNEDKFKKEVEKNKAKAIEQWNKIQVENIKQEENIKKEDEDRGDKKISSRIGLLIYLGLCIFSFHIMPFGIITLLISIIGFLVCLATAF